jgi:ABC-type multidrug transport system ATPase subunit/pSer/pThr/pTyr-binding forkhead associated (FHA) protein
MTAEPAIPSDAPASAEGLTRQPRLGPPAQSARLFSAPDHRAIALDGPGPWVLGRGDTADIVFDDPYCSRIQTRLARDGDEYLLESVSQSAVTTVNGRAVLAQVRLRTGDQISFASQNLVFSVDMAETTVVARRDKADAAPQLASAGKIVIGSELVLGRDAGQGTFTLSHPVVSRRHAVIRAVADGHEIEDMGSTNGTFVNGMTVRGAGRLVVGDRIDVGPFSFVYDGLALDGESREGKASLSVRGISVDVRDNTTGKPLRILNDVALDIHAREFVCIIGASGSGKSTLMGVLSARRSASTGAVTLNGLDLHQHFEALKQDVSFVPQNDILHEQLTLRQALTFAAKLRLPPDMTPAALADIVTHAAASVDLAHRLDVKIATLSGGQKKRASLACEILNRPSLLFLDEVTSGLDESTDREIMRLLRRLANEGMTIVCVTHTLTNIEEYCDKAVTMGSGGHLAYFGSPKETLAFFGISRLGLVFDRLDEDGATFWRERFEQARRPLTAVTDGTKLVQLARSVSGHWARAVRQFGLLVERGIALLLADRRNLIMAAIQSVLIGALMGLAFQDFGTEYQRTPSTVAMLMLLGIAALWLGCNGASKDIVGQLAIYRRERDVNLSTGAYVLSKFVVTGAFTVLQLLVVFLLAASLADRLPGSPGTQFFVLSLASLIGTAMGLVISAAANTRDQANTIVPLALVPQLILSGSLVPNLPKWIDALSQAVISTYWITETMIGVAALSAGPLLQFNIPGVASALRLHQPFDFQRYGEIARSTQPVGLGITVLILHVLALVGIAYGIMLYRHHRRAGQ